MRLYFEVSLSSDEDDENSYRLFYSDDYSKAVVSRILNRWLNRAFVNDYTHVHWAWVKESDLAIRKARIFSVDDLPKISGNEQ